MRIIILPLLLLSNILIYSQNESINKAVDVNKGYFNITKIGFISNTEIKQELFIEGRGNIFGELETNNSSAWSLQTINGYFISPYFSLGIAIGIDGYQNPNFNTLPVLLDVRVYLSEDDNSFYSFIDIGPSIRIGGKNSDFRKGMVLNFGVGYKFKVSQKLFLISDLSYAHKTVSLTDEGITKSDNIIKTKGVGLSLGVIF